MPQPVVHFEIPADHPDRLSRFYEDLFGWRVEKWPGPMDYWLLYTREKGTAAIDGGMYRRELPDQRPVNYVLVPSAAEFAEKAQRLGGRVILPRTQVPGVGYLAILADPEGNNIGLFETGAPRPAAATSPATARKAPVTQRPVKKGPVKKGPRRTRSRTAARKASSKTRKRRKTATGRKKGRRR